MNVFKDIKYKHLLVIGMCLYRCISVQLITGDCGKLQLQILYPGVFENGEDVRDIIFLRIKYRIFFQKKWECVLFLTIW